MPFERLGAAWHAYQQRIRSDVRVLVVDDEESVCELLLVLLSTAGYIAEAARDVGSGLERLEEGAWDLVVADKNLPDGSGIDLIRAAQVRGIPSVLITGYPSATTVVDALTAGARDYIAKPFDDVDHVVARIASVIDRRLADRLNERMVGDLSKALEQGPDKAFVAGIAGALFEFKRELSTRPAVLVVEDNPAVADVVRRILGGIRLPTEVAGDLSSARTWLERADGPLTALVSVDMSESLALIRDLRKMDPLLEIVVTTGTADTELALGAVALGAADYVLRPFEGVDVLRARMQRAVARARRQRLHLNLLATLYRAAQESGDGSAERLLAVLPVTGTHAPSTRALALAPEPEEVDLSDLMEGEAELAVDLLTVGPSTPEVTLRPAGPEDDALPWIQGETLEDHERRSARRVEANLEVRFRTPDAQEFVYTHLRDLSAGGMFIHMEQPLPVGTHLAIELLLGWNDDPVRVRAEVVRCVRGDPEHPGYTGIGVRMIEAEDMTLLEVVDDLARRLIPV